MKNTIKIALIAMAAISAISAVVYFVISGWSSAPEFTSTNQYYNEIIQTVNKFPKVEESTAQSDSLYKVIDHKINLYNKNNRLTERENDAAIESFMGKYVPIFLNQSFKRFANSVWNENDLAYMKSRIQALRSFRVKRGHVIEKGSDPDTKFDVILGVIDKYNEAKSLILKKNYMNIADTKNKIGRVKSLIKDKYLSKCTAIKNSLNDLSEEIHNSHFTEVKIAVHRMYEYQTLDRNEFERIADEANTMINDYKDNANALYGHIKNTSDLETIKNTQNNNASNYYASLNRPAETFTVQQPSTPTRTTPATNPTSSNKPNVKAFAPILQNPDPKSKQVGNADNTKIVFLNKHNDKYYRVMQGTVIGYLSVDNILK